ncbi:hypothetical protein KEJ33_04530 [Candidatus Bathyarchaeota archaeon]|nr:hypothetical protein [Candidatus Bathyarchaeota archaeon]
MSLVLIIEILVSVIAFFPFVNTVCCPPLKPKSTLIYSRPNGRIGSITLLSSGQLLFTNYPTKPGKILLINQSYEIEYYTTGFSTRDYFGVAVSPQGEIHISVPATGQIFKIGPNKVEIAVFGWATKNVGSIAFAPNGTLFMAETIPTEGYQSIYRLEPDPSSPSVLRAIKVFTPQQAIGGIAFNSKGELFYSDGPKGRLWKVVNGTSQLYVDKGSWSTMYGIAFDPLDNVYFCDWSSPGNIYYLDFTISLTYQFLSNKNIPLNGATVSVKLPNNTVLQQTTNSTGHVSLSKAFQGSYELSVKWQGVSVGQFTYDETASISRKLQCNVYDLKITAKDSQGQQLENCTLNIQLPNGTAVKTSSPASLILLPAGIVTAAPTYKNVQVAEPYTINLTTNLDVSISCQVHSLSVEVTDSGMTLLNNPLIQVFSADGTLIANQTSTSGKLTLKGLLNGRYTVAVNLRQLRVAETEVNLNSSQTVVLRANLSKIVLTAKDIFGSPVQGVNVQVTLSDGSIFSGTTNESGVYTLTQLPMVNAQILVYSENERKEFSVNLNEPTVELSATFTFSSNVKTWLTIGLSAFLVVLVLVIPKTRHSLVKLIRAIPIEVSFETEEKNLATMYSRFLSTVGLQIEEAKETTDEETRIIVEGKVLPSLQTREEHAVFLVSDNNVMPSRKEIRVVKQLREIKTDSVTLSKLAYAYSQATGIKAYGILICDKVTDNMLNNIKDLKGEVVLMQRQTIQAMLETS